MEEIKHDSNCIIKAFENNNVSIIHEDINNKKSYWFKAADIAKILDLTNIRVSIQNYDEDEKGVRKAYTPGGNQEIMYLSSQGIYRLLYSSKKPIAKQFRKWVGDILDDLVFNQGIEIRKQLEEKNKLLLDQKEINIKDSQSILLDSYNKKCIVYLILIENELYKFGNTDIKI